MVLELLFENIDIELLGLNSTDNPKDLKFDVEIQEIPRAVVTDSVQKDILLYSGDRGIIPKFEKYIKEGLVAKYKDYVAYSDNEKTILEVKK